MLIRAAVAALSVFAVTAVSVAGARGSAPAPEALRPCGSRGDGSKPQELPTPVGERIGPLVIWPSIRSRPGDYGPKAEWAFYAKAPIVLPARTKVTLVVPPEATHLIGFQAAGGAWVSSVRFEACRENVRAYRGAYNGTVGTYTGFPFGFGLARPSMCVPLEVWVEGRTTPIRRLVPVGRRTCGKGVGEAGTSEVRVQAGMRVGVAGVTVAVPGEWRNIRQATAAKESRLTDPATRVVAASGPIAFGRGCNDLDYSFAAAAVAIVVVEWVGRTPGANWSPRPKHFTNGNLPVRPGALECFKGAGGGVQFAQRGRRFAAYLLAGRRAPAALVDRARAVLDSLNVEKPT